MSWSHSIPAEESFTGPFCFLCRPSAQSSEDDMQYDVILISLGTRYHMYCANISRTYLVDPNKSQQAQYEALLEAQEAAIDALQPGRPMSDAYAAVVKTLEVKPGCPTLDALMSRQLKGTVRVVKSISLRRELAVAFERIMVERRTRARRNWWRS